MAFERPAPDLNKLLTAWEAWEKGEEMPGRVLANLKTAGLAEILAEVRELDYDKNVMHGREGMVGERQKTEIGMHAVRGGDVVGDHTVIYANVGERVELTHKASSRATFALGALRAAKFLSGKAHGLFDMQDVLNLR